jgi:AcrR family transcriptional regulator
MAASRDIAGTPAAETRRGRPRSERARRAILAAAADLLLEDGAARLSMGAIAERAGVSKATIYRWWPSKEMLALEALLDWTAVDGPDPDTGTLRGDLMAHLLPWVREIGTRPFGRVIAALVAEAQADERFAAAYRTHFIEQRRAPMRAAFERAIARGEVSSALDVEAAIDLIYGPVYHRVLHAHAPLTEGFATIVVELALEGMLR